MYFSGTAEKNTNNFLRFAGSNKPTLHQILPCPGARDFYGIKTHMPCSAGSPGGKGLPYMRKNVICDYTVLS